MGATTQNKPTNGFKLADITNMFKGETDKASSEYKLNPSEPIQEPMKEESFEEIIDKKKIEIERMETELEVDVAEIEIKKRAKIQKRKAKRKTFREWLIVAKTTFSEKLEKHKSIFLISVLLFFASVGFHTLSFEVFIRIFLPTLFTSIVLILALLISLGLEGLATSLYAEYKDTLAHSIYLLSFSVIVGMGYRQYSLGQDVQIAVWRTILGSISLIGLYACHSAIRSKEFWESRKDFNDLPRNFRKQINSLFEKVVSEHKAGNTDYRLNHKDICKTWNCKSSSLEKLEIRHGIRDKKIYKRATN